MANVNSITIGNTTLPVTNSLASLNDTNIPANPAAGSILTLQNGKWEPTASVLNTPLTGLDTSQGGVVTAGDTVLSAIGKMLANDAGVIRNYSAAQKEIGTWLGDRKLYQKTIVITNPTIPYNRVVSYQLPELVGHALGNGTDFGWVEACWFRNTNSSLMTVGAMVPAMGVVGRTTIVNASTLSSYAAYCGFVPENGTFYLFLGGNLNTNQVFAVVNYVRTKDLVPF